jgi:hypothetical protein
MAQLHLDFEIFPAGALTMLEISMTMFYQCQCDDLKKNMDYL